MKSQNLSRLSLAISGALLFAGCSQYAVISEKRPRLLTGQLAPKICQEFIALGQRHEHGHSMQALGEYLAAADAAAAQLKRAPKDQAALDAYNFAVSRVFSTINHAKLEPWNTSLRVPSASGDYTLTTKRSPKDDWKPGLYEFTPADQVAIGGTYVSERSVKPGLGAPLVAISKRNRADARATFVKERVYYGVTGIVHFEPGRRCVISIEDPLDKETVSLDGHTYSMAADFTLPLAVMLAKENPKKIELARVLRPEKYAETAKIVRLEPYRPQKAVLLVVHGLMDSPATWTPMINRLRNDPFIRHHYQIWYYSYPTGYPYPYSAAILRRELDTIEKKYPLTKPMVVVGHSMGGIISRLLITDSGDKIWLAIFGKQPDKMKLTPFTRQMLTDSLIFKHRSEIGRAIFIAAPHRGSDLAGNWLGRIGSMIVKAPSNLLKVAMDVKHLVQADPSALKVTHIPNSVDTLAPNNRFVKVINTIPITPGIPYHSIIGDRGRGDTPKSSDGFVPYWSSHLEGAQSELIVPSNHSAHQNAEAIAEVDRILHLQAGSK